MKKMGRRKRKTIRVWGRKSIYIYIYREREREREGERIGKREGK